MAELPRLIFTPDLVEGGDRLDCPFCHNAIRPGEYVVQCPECSTWHHADCWVELGNRCSQFGCAGEGEVGPLPEPPPPAPEPSWLLDEGESEVDLPPSSPPPPPSSLLDEIELTSADPLWPDQAKLLGQLVDTIELLPADAPEAIADIVIDITIPAAPPAAAPPLPRPPEINCPYCHTAIDPAQPAVACLVCRTPYHPGCWAAAGRCSVTGCDSRRSGPYSPAGSAPTPLDVDLPQKKPTLLSRLKAWWANRS